MGERNKFIIEVLEDMFPSCLYEGKSVSFLSIERFFLPILRWLFFKTVIMLRSFNWKCSVNRAHCSALCYTEQSYVHSQELQSTKHCQTRAPPSLYEGSQSHPTGGLQAREGSERLREVPLASLNPYGPLCPYVIVQHRSPPIHSFSSTRQIILRCTHAAACLILHSFVFLNSVALYGCFTVCFSIHLWTIWAVPRHKQSNCLLLCLRIQRPLCILVKDLQKMELVWVCVCACVWLKYFRPGIW